jgi:cytoskeletal protein CcmA (bactofilin family)
MMGNDKGNVSRQKRTVVEEGSHFKGVLVSRCPIDVRGHIEGELVTPSLSVGKTGAVHGSVKVGSMRSEGELSGEFDANRADLAGVIKDNTVIRARSVEVKLASSKGKMQVVFTECEPAPADESIQSIIDSDSATEAEATAADVDAQPVEPAGHVDGRRRHRNGADPERVDSSLDGSWSSPPGKYSEPPPAAR